MAPTICGGLRESSTSRLADPLLHLQGVKHLRLIARSEPLPLPGGFDAPDRAPIQP